VFPRTLVKTRIDFYPKSFFPNKIKDFTKINFSLNFGEGGCATKKGDKNVHSIFSIFDNSSNFWGGSKSLENFDLKIDFLGGLETEQVNPILMVRCFVINWKRKGSICFF
jgi:hypothetical protein